MKITKIVATDEQGVEHHFEGVEGYLKIRSINYKKQPYQKQVEAVITLPPEEGINA